MLEVSDDGQGVSPSAAPGIGLQSLRARAASMGGHLEIHSGAGEGTRIVLRVPSHGRRGGA